MYEKVDRVKCAYSGTHSAVKLQGFNCEREGSQLSERNLFHSVIWDCGKMVVDMNCSVDEVVRVLLSKMGNFFDMITWFCVRKGGIKIIECE